MGNMVMVLKNTVHFLFSESVCIIFCLQVRVSTVEALGQMVGLVTRTQLKSALPRLVPTILEL